MVKGDLPVSANIIKAILENNPGSDTVILAEQIHKLTTTKGPDGKEVVNVQANLIAHAVVGAVTSYASGNPALAGASGAAMGEYIAQQMYPGVKREDLSEEQRQTISALGTLAAGLAGGVAGDSTGGAVAGAQAGRNAVENNYLSQKQQAQKKEELAECQSVACKAQTQAKWTAVDLGQDGSFAAGMVAGVPAGLYDAVDSIVKTASSPVETYEALKALFNSGDVLGNVSDAVKQSYIDRIDRMEAEYQKAGASGSFNAGVEGGKLVTDIASLLAGGAGVVKGGAVLTEKVVAKVVSKTGKAIPDMPPSAWKSGEGEFSLKPDKTVTNVEYPGGQYDGNSLPYKTSVEKGTTTITYPDGVNFRIDQPKHLATVDGFTQKNGISGGHNSNAFYDAAKEYNVKIVSETPTGVKGITEVKYLIPTKDRAGNLTGDYKATPETKTIYDPKIFSDQKILELGQQAAASGYKEAMSSPNGTANVVAGGVSFRIYVDKSTGTVRNFHPN